MRLGIDLDGVVADFNRGWIVQYNHQYGAGLALDAVRSWDSIPLLTHFEDMSAFWDWARDHDGHSVFRHLETYPGALEALHSLAEARHNIVILTTKPDWALSDTFIWLGEKGLKTREVHILEDKWRVDCDVYLDDAPHILRALVAKRPERMVCRFVRPWNSPIEGALDVADWPEFVQRVASHDR
jgi:5'(3')-deoxyribonucleotidase